MTGIIVPIGSQIDHCDQDKSNNTFDNLKCLTRQEHMGKTHIENPHVVKSLVERVQRKVVRISMDGSFFA